MFFRGKESEMGDKPVTLCHGREEYSPVEIIWIGAWRRQQLFSNHNCNENELMLCVYVIRQKC